jgi:hypothetical protein
MSQTDASTPSEFQEQFFATSKLLSQLHGSIQQRSEPRTVPHNSHSISLKPPSSEFLHRLAKVVAGCVKHAGDHVSATIFVRTHDNKPKIYIAKNQSPTQDGKDLVKKFQDRMRHVASCDEKDLPTDIDIMDLILVHLLGLIKDCLNDISHMSLSVLASLCVGRDSSEHAKALRDLWSLCSMGSISRWVAHDMLTLVDEVREGLLPSCMLPKREERTCAIIRLGRVFYVAYRTFRDTAQSDPTFQDLKIKFVDHSAKDPRYMPARVKATMHDVNNRLGHPVSHPECRAFQGIKICCHAEIQLLYHMEYIMQTDTPYMYIGGSKRACFLCQQFGTNYHSKFNEPYHTRGSHGQVYLPWNTTLFPIHEGSPAHDCLKKVQDHDSVSEMTFTDHHDPPSPPQTYKPTGQAGVDVNIEASNTTPATIQAHVTFQCPESQTKTSRLDSITPALSSIHAVAATLKRKVIRAFSEIVSGTRELAKTARRRPGLG